MGGPPAGGIQNECLDTAHIVYTFLTKLRLDRKAEHKQYHQTYYEINLIPSLRVENMMNNM